jgi:cytochrome b pre-mRNA-processing protein 3
MSGLCCQAPLYVGFYLSRHLVRRLSRQRAAPAALGLPDRFAATYSLLCLHVWLLLVRLRREGDDGRELAQILYEAFQDDVEIRVHAEGVKVTSFPQSSAPE